MKYSLNGVLPKVYSTVESLQISIVLCRESDEYLVIDAEKVDGSSWARVEIIHQKKVGDNYWLVTRASVTRDDWKYDVEWTVCHHAHSTALYDDCQDYEPAEAAFDPDAEIWEIQAECLNRTLDHLKWEREWHEKKYSKGIAVLEDLL